MARMNESILKSFLNGVVYIVMLLPDMVYAIWYVITNIALHDDVDDMQTKVIGMIIVVVSI